MFIENLREKHTEFPEVHDWSFTSIFLIKSSGVPLDLNLSFNKKTFQPPDGLLFKFNTGYWMKSKGFTRDFVPRIFLKSRLK